MGLGGISVSSLLLIFMIVILLFGTRKLRDVGEDLGTGLRSFRKAMQEGSNTNVNQAEIAEESKEVKL